MLSRIKKWSFYSASILVLLVVVYAVGRVIHVAMGSIYNGERGPYLQMLSATAVTLRWQTQAEYSGRIRYGVSPRQLNQQAEEAQADEEHELRLKGLQPATRYYYQITDEQGKALYAGQDYWFMTAPQTGQMKPVRIWVTGDQGLPGEAQYQVRDAALQWIQDHPRQNQPDLNLWITTGDNAYSSGTNKQFQAALFEPYKTILRNTVIWPAYGNHDARRWAFFDVFSLPQQGESGGMPSTTEHYYSFDYGMVHVIMLDSQSSSMAKGSEMLSWLKQDLSQNKLPWTLAVFHHPPYTKGSHDSDDRSDSNGRMFAVREHVLPVLEQGGVNLVLSGHSHMYERSYLLKCHYGSSQSLTNNMIVNKQVKTSLTYQKPGTVYAVVGSSSRLDNGPLDHPAMPFSRHEMGSMLIDIDGARLTARFINRDGFVTDQFKIANRKTENKESKIQCN